MTSSPMKCEDCRHRSDVHLHYVEGHRYHAYCDSCWAKRFERHGNEMFCNNPDCPYCGMEMNGI